MIFSVLMLLLVGVIAFFHYTQGFFSATLSAIIAIFAACLAMSYHEVLVTSLLQGKFADQANAIGLVVIFAAVYLILRVMFDKFVPGNIRLPAIIDKIGAGFMGLIAGIFAAGTIAIAAQTLPFGPTVGMYTRYELGAERDVQIPTQGAAIDAKIYDEMKNDKFERGDSRSMMLPVDDMVVNTVDYLSRDGSLAGSTPLREVHPNYLDELFGNRLGIQLGVKRTALNLASSQQVTVDGVFSLEQVAQADGEIAKLRQGASKSEALKPPDTQVLLVVRTLFSKDATDNDNIFRFSPASARLVAGGQNYFPIGTLEKGNLLLRNRIDDYLFVEVQNDDRGADLVYLVDKKNLLEAPAGGKADAAPTIKPGVFLEVKRLGRVDLGEKKIVAGVKPSDKVQWSEKGGGGILRKPDVIKAAPAGGASSRGGASDGGSVALAAAPLTVEEIDTKPVLFTMINVGTSETDQNDIQLESGKVSLKERKFSVLAIEPTQTIQAISMGSYGVGELYVPAGKALVRISCRAPARESDDAWAWADNLRDFDLVDAAGARFKPSGAWCKLKLAKGQEHMIAQYNLDQPLASLSHTEGRPTSIWIAYLVPGGTHLKELSYKGKQLKALEQVV
jgi:hypothetical protein